MENEKKFEEEKNVGMTDIVENAGEPVKAKSKLNFLKKFNRKLTYIIIAIIVVLAVGYHYKSIFVAASVNGSLISRLSVVSELEKESGKQALDYVITQKLVSDAIKKSGVSVSPAELNAKIDTITQQVESQGTTLAATLESQGMTQKDFTDRVTTQIQLEKILADKITVSDAEVTQYMKDNKITIPKGTDPAAPTAQIKGSIQQTKFNSAVNDWVAALKAKAIIKYFVNY